MCTTRWTGARRTRFERYVLPQYSAVYPMDFLTRVVLAVATMLSQPCHEHDTQYISNFPSRFGRRRCPRTLGWCACPSCPSTPTTARRATRAGRSSPDSTPGSSPSSSEMSSRCVRASMVKGLEILPDMYAMLLAKNFK